MLTWTLEHRWLRQLGNANHARPLYPNLAREFVYLAVILDAISRRAIGWALECYFDTRLTAAALRMEYRRSVIGEPPARTG